VGNLISVTDAGRGVMTTFKAFATYSAETRRPTSFQAWAELPSLEEARAIAKAFPKFAKVKAGKGGRWEGDEYKAAGIVSFLVRFDNEGVQGDQNETGLKRLRAFLERAGEIELNPIGAMLNTYATLDEFKRAVGLEAPEQSIKP
jgi:hypothetical protein